VEIAWRNARFGDQVPDGGPHIISVAGTSTAHPPCCEKTVLQLSGYFATQRSKYFDFTPAP